MLFLARLPASVGDVWCVGLPGCQSSDEGRGVRLTSGVVVSKSLIASAPTPVHIISVYHSEYM